MLKPLANGAVLPGKFLCALLLVTTVASATDAQVQDTILKKSTLVTGKDVAVLGAFALGTALIAPVDRQIAAQMQNPGPQGSRFLRTAGTSFRLLAVPGSLITAAGLYVVGRADHQPRIQAAGLHSVESILISDVVVGGIKVLAGRQRPYVDVKNPYDFQLGRGFKGNDFQSFPSGHASNAFAFASTVTRESQFWWPHSGFYVGSVLYGGATLMGISRIYNNAHWASDVVAGAALGTVIGLKVEKYTHSHPGNSVDERLIEARRQKLVPVPVVLSFTF